MTNGYGKMWDKGKKRLAHRVSYELFNGSIPEGLQIDHLCFVRNCVNPAHLEAVTAETNVLRGNSDPAQNARKTFCKRGHEFTEQNTNIRKDGSRNCRICDKGRSHRYRMRKLSKV